MVLPLHIRVATGGLPSGDVIVVFARGARELPLPNGLRREVATHLARVQFRGGEQETHAVPIAGKPLRTLFVVGYGAVLSTRDVRRGVAAGVQFAKAEGLPRVAVLPFPSRGRSKAPPRTRRGTQRPALWPAGIAVEFGRAIAEGALLANYRFTTYTSEAARRERRLRLAGLDVVVPRNCVQEVSQGLRRGTVDATAAAFARDLVNEPASRLTPSSLAEQAQHIASASGGRTRLTLLDQKECEARGMGAFLAVARGSAQPPVFIHLVHQPNGRKEHRETSLRVVLIGKGITFDSGGLSLKPAEGMETMKIDMAGAAAVLGVFTALPRLNVHTEVHGMIAACENMPSGAAVKPGDIVRTVSGKTVEVLNTDAEGRLTLADALGEAVKLKPHAIIDLATLTGACVVSLGEEVGGLFSTSDTLADAVSTAAAAAGEPVWRLPLVREYRTMLKSEVADIKNITGKRSAGAITAALFLKEFVREVPWAHLDIAGPSYAERQTNPVLPVGGTGFGVRTVLRYLETLSASA